MSFYPAIQNFTSASTTSANNAQCVLDWQNVYPYQTGSPFAITRFDFATGNQLSTSNMPGTSLNGSCVIDTLGFLYARHSVANYNGVSQANGATYVLTGSFGTDSSTNNLPNSIPGPGNFAIIKVGSDIWLLSTALIPIGTDMHSISAVLVGNTTLKFGGHLFSMNGGNWSICAGPQGVNAATAYTLAGPTSLVATPVACELYKTVVLPSASGYSPLSWPIVPNPFITSTLVISIAPADVDGTWSTINGNGLCYDQTDGNLIASIFTQDAVAHPNYVLKIHSGTGAILWRVPTPQPAANQVMMPLSRIRHGTFAVLNASSTLKQVTVINTLTGAYTTTSTGYNGLLTGGPQAYDDTTGALVVNVDYSSGAGAPTPIGSTPASFSGWAALYVQPFYQPPPRAKTRTWQTTYLP